MQCPTHVKKLEPILSPTNQQCQNCGSLASFYCKQCKYYQCSQCRLCTARHNLLKIIDLCKIKPEYYNNSYSCNGCSKSKTVDDDGIWHCNECNYDMCAQCLE